MDKRNFAIMAVTFLVFLLPFQLHSEKVNVSPLQETIPAGLEPVSAENWTPTIIERSSEFVYLQIDAADVVSGVQDGDFTLNVWVTLTEEMYGGSLGFTWDDSANWQVDSVIVGPAIAHLEIQITIDIEEVNASAKVLIQAAGIFKTIPAGADQLWGTIYFSETQNSTWATPDTMWIDSVSVLPLGHFLLQRTNGETFVPNFVGAINVHFSDIKFEEAGVAIPENFNLSQNYPNPFNPTTKISLSLVEATNWEIAIYNIQGQKIEAYSGRSGPGTVEMEWDASAFASGVYFYKATAGEFTATRKMILLK